MTPWDVGNAPDWRLEIIAFLDKWARDRNIFFWAVTWQQTKDTHDILMTRVKENNFTICIPGSFWCYTRVSSMTKVSKVAVIQDVEFVLSLMSQEKRKFWLNFCIIYFQYCFVDYLLYLLILSVKSFLYLLHSCVLCQYVVSVFILTMFMCVSYLSFHSLLCSQTFQ